MSKSMGLRTLSAFLAAMSVWGGSAHAGLIDVAFAGGSPLTVMGAGVIGSAGDTWNGILTTTTATSSGSNIALNDTTGLNTGVLLSYSGAGLDVGPYSGTSPNPNLTSRYSDSFTAPGNSSNIITVSLSGLIAGAGYNLYVYDVAPTGSRPGQVTIAGGSSATFTSNNTLSTWVAGSNYVELMATANSTGSLSFTISPTGGNHEVDFNGFQLQTPSVVPEPGSFVLSTEMIGLLGAGWFLRRGRLSRS